MTVRFKNNATSVLLVTTSSGSATITLPSGDGAKFPQPSTPDYSMVTLEDRRTGQIEICKLNSRVADVLNVTRAQEGTLAQDFAAGATVSNRMTAAVIEAIQVSIGGVPEAPVDGNQYARKNAAWSVVVGGGISEAPNDGNTYGRKSLAWIAIGAGGGIPEAPIDGTTYGRNNATWVSVGAGGGITDAPNDGKAYVRKSAAWAQDNANAVTWTPTVGSVTPIFVSAELDANRTKDTSQDTSIALKADKTYVDSQDALALPKAGGTMTGLLVLSGAPSTGLNPATKTYTDAADTTLQTNINAKADTAAVLLIANNLSDVPNKPTARTNLGLAIGSNVQAWSQKLDDITGLGVTANNFMMANGTTWTSATPATARTGLGLTSAATTAIGTSGATIPLLSTANTWTLQQTMSVRPVFNGAVPWDSANLTIGTSGATVPLLSTANTWTLQQTFSVRPIFNGQTPWDNGNLVAPLKADTVAQSLTGGTRITTFDAGTKSSGTFTPDPGNGPHQKYINNGAHTLAPDTTNTGDYLMDITNGATAGAITTTGWTKVGGDAFTTVNTNKFRCSCSVNSVGSTLVVMAMQ